VKNYGNTVGLRDPGVRLLERQPRRHISRSR